MYFFSTEAIVLCFDPKESVDGKMIKKKSLIETVVHVIKPVCLIKYFSLTPVHTPIAILLSLLIKHFDLYVHEQLHQNINAHSDLK